MFGRDANSNSAALVCEIDRKEIPGLKIVIGVDAALAKIKECKALRTLELKWSDVTDAGLVHLKELKGLQTLCLSDTGVTDAGLAHLKELKGLQTLNLGITRVTDAGLVHLKELKGLQTLVLTGTRVTDAGLVHLKELKGLQTLNLVLTHVTDAGLVHLKDLKGLQTLNLRLTGLSDVGLVHLKELKGLRTLCLSGRRVTDAGLVHLKDLKGLQTLRLSGTGVTDAGLVHLKAMEGLRTVDLDNTKVTNAACAQLPHLRGKRPSAAATPTVVAANAPPAKRSEAADRPRVHITILNGVNPDGSTYALDPATLRRLGERAQPAALSVADIVGRWQGQGISLNIKADGGCVYDVSVNDRGDGVASFTTVSVSPDGKTFTASVGGAAFGNRYYPLVLIPTANRGQLRATFQGRGLLFRRQGGPPRSTAGAGQDSAAKDKTANGYLEMARTMADRGSPEKARTWAQKAIEAAPKSKAAAEARAMIKKLHH